MSADSDDPGFAAYDASMRDGQKVDVLLDGVVQREVITADEEKGTVVCVKLDAEGYAQVDPDDRNKIATETHCGTVTIRVSPDVVSAE